MPKAGLDKNPKEIIKMFDFVAKKYDVTNTILSFGQDKHWREVMVKSLNIFKGMKILDLAAGTGVSTIELNRAGANAIAADFSEGMLLASKRDDLPKVVADAMNLPFQDKSFDAVTISFGLRNMLDIEKVFYEIHRVLKPNGKILICEFSTPTNKFFSTLYKNYLLKYLPGIAKLVSSNPEAYEYLSESIVNWHTQENLAKILEDNKFTNVKWLNLTGGIVSIHLGNNPI